MTTRLQRRAKGSGSVRERPPGTGRWQIRYEGPPDTDGDRKTISETFRGSRREADRRLQELLGLVESGSYIEKSRDTLGEYLDRWLTTYVAQQHSAQYPARI